jgi:hypothetical protein
MTNGMHTMMLVHSNFGPAKSFRLIPVTGDCPYVEVLFDPQSGTLVPVLNVIKQAYHMLPKLDDNGDPVRMKLGTRDNGKEYKEERRLVETFTEFYLSEESSIKSFIEFFANNHESFDWNSFIPKGETHSPIITM